MRALLQRVSHASVSVDGETVGEIGEGLLILLGVGEGDTDAELDTLANKIVHLRLFRDERGRFDRSLLDTGGGALVVSQFTLYADCRKGRRPSFTGAARPEVASPMCDRFAERLRELGVSRVETGVFGASMQVSLLNDGPVTVWLDTAEMSSISPGFQPG
ncbi:MAG: D-aminoacyl-tRNA deacylase [Planctomycetota bacterium]